MQQLVNPIKITLGDKLGVFFWRHIAMPAIAAIGGKKYPSGKVTEFAYGDLPDEQLDFIAPSPSSEKRLAIVHIHGGAWIAGSKGNFYSKPLMKFSEVGYPVFSLNYPLAPKQQHPYMLRSLLKALVWIKKKYPQHDTIHLIGDSAGGNLAMMLGIFMSNPSLLRQLDSIDINALPKIKTVVDLFGVNDRTSWVEDGFPSAKLFTKVYIQNTTTPKIPMVPMDFENIENLPPTFIVGAGNDKLLRSSKIWAEHISKKFKDIEFKIYEGADEVIDYKSQDVTTLVKNVDLVADCAGGEAQSKLFEVLKSGGKLLSIAGMPSPELAQKYNIEARFVSSNLSAKSLENGLKLVLEGKIKPIIAKIFPLAEAAQAQDFVSAGGVNGKVVLEVS